MNTVRPWAGGVYVVVASTRRHRSWWADLLLGDRLDPVVINAGVLAVGVSIVARARPARRRKKES
jgi:hypothetical protein